MNLYVLIAASSAFLVIILLIIKTNFSSKKRIRYKDRATLNQMLEEEEYIENKSKSQYDLAIANPANFHQGDLGVANNTQKINFSDKKPLEMIVDDLANFDKNSPETLFPHSTDLDTYYENQPDAVDYTQNSSEKSSKNYELGLLLLKGKKFKESIEYFDKAIEINPADGIPFYYRGLAKSNINLIDEAIEDYTDAMLRKLNIIDVFYQRGISKYKAGDKSGALNDLIRYVSVEKSNAEAFYYKGLIEFENEAYSTAIEEFNRTIILNPNHASAYFKRGMAKHHTGNNQSSCRDLKTAYEKGNLEAFHYLKQFCKE